MTRYAEPTYPLGDLPRGVRHADRTHFMCQRTGEHRYPKAGEWYLSGAIPAGYRAPADLVYAYDIVRLVRAEIVTTWHDWKEPGR